MSAYGIRTIPASAATETASSAASTNSPLKLLDSSIGCRVRVRTHEPIDGAKSFSGELVEAADDAVSVAADTGIVRIPFADIHKSNLLEG